MRKRQLQSTSAIDATDSVTGRTGSVFRRRFAQIGVTSAVVLSAASLAAFSVGLATSDDILHASFTNAVDNSARAATVFAAVNPTPHQSSTQRTATNVAASESDWLGHAGQSQNEQLRPVAWGSGLSLGDELSVTIGDDKRILTVVDVQQLPAGLRLSSDGAEQSDEPAGPIVLVTGREQTDSGHIRIVRFIMDAEALAKADQTRRIDHAL